MSQFAHLTEGTRVSYAETFRGIKWKKIGTVVENPGLGRVRVRWSHWEYEGGGQRQDNKRTWVKGSKCCVIPTDVTPL